MQDVSKTPEAERSTGIRELVLFLLLAVVVVIASFHSPIGQFFSMENMQKAASRLGFWGIGVIFAVGVISPILFLPRWPVAFVAGLLYGVLWGTCLAVTASTIGAMVHFGLAKSLLAPMSDRLRKKHPVLSQPVPRDKAFLVVLFLRAFPLSSFVVTNMLAGAMRIHFRTYTIASVLGMIPSTIMYAAWGKLLKKPSSSHGTLVLVTGLFILIGTIIARKHFYPWLKSLRPAAEAEKS